MKKQQYALLVILLVFCAIKLHAAKSDTRAQDHSATSSTSSTQGGRPRGSATGSSSQPKSGEAKGLTLPKGGSSSGSGGIGSPSSSGKLCPETKVRINDKRVYSFQDLTRMFANYATIPKLGARGVVAVDVQAMKPCGAFATNSTFYIRVGLRDIKQFKRVFQNQVLRLTSTFFKHLPEEQPRRILDLGARTGLTTAYLAATFPKAQIIATEPFLPEFSLLRLNTAFQSNVHAEYGAIWDSKATLKLGRGSRGGPSPSSQGGPLWHRFVVDVAAVATGGRLGDIVPSVTIAELMERHGWPDVDLLIADLDGAEKVVLGDLKAHATWLRKVKCIGLKLDPDQSVNSVSKLLGQDFIRSGSALDEYFWCRQ